MSKDVFHIMFTLIRNQSVLVGGASGEIQSLCLSVSLSLSMPDIIIQLVLVFHARWRAAAASFPYFPPAGARICWQ